MKYPTIALWAFVTRIMIFNLGLLGGVVVILMVISDGVFIPGINLAAHPLLPLTLALWYGFLWFALLINGVDMFLHYKVYTTSETKEGVERNE